ncbi:MAG: cupin domain-containing protein [Burkholderiaceae bacterium]|jgi:quercetin dioxygenase-like cupin family protein|nr:cupin domain-containing protein [Burkholderiaceae bacterium]MEB2317560.1 cupin domain-containing protein [Pseudomonadota bacterium]
MNRPTVRHARDGFRWDGVDLLRYKDEGAAPFRDVTRQVLFDEVPAGTQWRYFEVAPGGHSTLERHQHTHAVLVLRGRGRVLVGNRVHAIAAHDLVEIEPLAWHQFRADTDEALGFLCLVAADRDRPQLPDDAQFAALRADPVVAAFLQPENP